LSQRKVVAALVFCAITGVIDQFVYGGIFDSVPSAFDYGIVRFYGWSWIVVFTMFGGMEVATAWSPIPAVILAVGLQNAVIYFLIARFATWIRSDRRNSEDDES